MKKGLKFLDYLMLGAFFLYPLIFICGGVKFFNSARFVWSVILPLFVVWLAFNYNRFNIRFSLNFLSPFAPIILAAIILSIWHHKFIDMETISKLVILGVVSGALSDLYDKRLFYIANSVFCFVALAWMVWFAYRYGLQVFFDRLKGVVNQNEIYPIVALMSGVSLLVSHTKIGKERAFHLLAGLAGIVAVFLTQARGGLLVILVLLLFFLFSSSMSVQLKVQILLIVLVACIGFLYMTNGYQGKMMRVFTEIPRWLDGKGQSTSIGARLSLWYAGLVDVFPHFPFMGTGVKQGHLVDLTQLVVLTKRAGWSIARWPHFHNDFVQMIVEGGIFYLFAGISSIVMLIAKYRRNLVVLWMLSCAIVTGMTEIFYFQPRDFVFFVMLLVLIEADFVKNQPKTEPCG